MDHVVTIQDLTDDDIVSVLDRARELLPVAHGDERSDVLAGKILATCFFEPSTRTRLSFETAMHRLAGDVIGFPALASTAMEQARIAMVHAFNLKYKTELATILPYGIYTIPECSMAGKTEEELKSEDFSYVAGKAKYNANARGQIIGDEEGFLKLLFDKKDMKLLGVHVIGESASELVHVGLTALLTGADADLFIHTCYNYPTLTELYKYATYDALGQRAKA